MRIGILTLGCDKNTVDAEYLAGLLTAAGCTTVPVRLPQGTPLDESLDAVAVITCGFIADARDQSVEAIVALAEAKAATGNPARLYATGCLSQKHGGALLDELPELDGVAGVGHMDEVAAMILAEKQKIPRNKIHTAPSTVIRHAIPRRELDSRPYAFLKIADGCSHTCAFCAIPQMKGPYRSVAPDILLEEARALVQRGAREINLVAQDITVYGADLGGYRLPELLRDICSIDGDFWLRCLYAYPGGITDAIIDTIAAQPKIVPYLDIPLQHFDPGVLRRMRRPFHDMDTAGLVNRLRGAIPGLALRTTVIVGFPGETPAAHRAMLRAIETLRFERLGAFAYSREEDTPAAAMPRQVGKATMAKRLANVLEMQAEVSQDWNESRIGTRIPVLVEEYDPEREMYIARGHAEAPEVDGIVYVHAESPLSPGQFLDVTVTAADTYDIAAKL